MLQAKGWEGDVVHDMNDQSVVLHYALLLYYRVYDLLFRKKMLRKYSPEDVLLHLSLISKMKRGDRWVLSEIPKQHRALMEEFGMDIPIP